jgi:hypothetical protein
MIPASPILQHASSSSKSNQNVMGYRGFLFSVIKERGGHGEESIYGRE